MMTDRNRNYIPRPTRDGGELKASDEIEIGQGEHRKMLPLALGKADELNETNVWWWARLDPDGGEHWIHADRGHRIQVELEMKTWNRREVNDWKGRDEIRAAGEWVLKLNHEPAWGGYVHDALWTLSEIQRRLRWLIEDACPISWHRGQGYADLIGRKIWYREQAATIQSTIGEQGCVMIQADDARGFTAPAWHRSEDGDYFEPGEDAKVELDSPHIWWWRD